ncbi:MAG: Trk system potassium transporter TrkA [Desulfobacterales bacterium]|nr:Trk system potassium transporter TrkA [Desulfobacterales bacterium]
MKIIIVGAGEVGYHIASRLAVENKDVVVIDRNPEALRRFADNVDVQVIPGSGSSPQILEEAGIREAEILLAVTDSDEANLVACLMAHILSPTTKKLARIRDAAYDKFHDTFRENAPHIDTIINPEIEVVKTIDMLLSVPGAVEVGEFADGRVKFVGIQIDPDSRVAGVKLVNLREKTGTIRPLIAAVVRDEELIIPRGKDRLLAGDLVYLICEDSKLIETLAVFDKRAEPLRRAMIIGGGRIGLRLATLLHERGVSTKIVEKSADHCARLAEELDGVVVLCGDGSDQNLLAEENIQDMDVVVTLTDDEETNILASLLATRWAPARPSPRSANSAILRSCRPSGSSLWSARGFRPSTRSCSTSGAAKSFRRSPSRASAPRSWKPWRWRPPTSSASPSRASTFPTGRWSLP